MKLALISDLHLDINKKYPVIEELAKLAKEENADGIIVAGDISETYTESISEMKRLEALADISVWYVPGNHDMWSNDFSAHTTDEIYQCFEQDPRCLTGKIVELKGNRENYYLIGDIGWYDYSFASEQYTKVELERMSLNGRTWQDYFKNQWTEDNKKKMQQMLEKLEVTLEMCKAHPVIAVTHMLPVEDFCVPKERVEWNYFNAFLGSRKLGELYEKYSVKYAVCGHVHYRKLVKRNGIEYHCPCLGYHREWKHATGLAAGCETDLKWHLEKSVQWIEC